LKHQEFFYVEPENIHSDYIVLKDQEYKHLIQVLRKKIGDSATATDGQGNAYDFFISEITGDSVRGTIQKKLRKPGEPFFRLTLAQAILKGNHFDWVIEKGTEIGVSRFIPLLTEYSIPDINEQKLIRWRRIALESIKQCCRSVIPEILPALRFEDLMREIGQYQFKIMAHPHQSALPMNLLLKNRPMTNHPVQNRNGIAIIGPEGGFNLAETHLAANNQIDFVSLGKRRLRAETAGIVLSTLIMEKMGEL
jgi:16S rRNA (uracil1498-N3)-methyltransferase